jgi:2-C-methyl-D-erythritol 2,4-cyclodiphosphate synthase
MANFRIGTGVDSHPLVAGRRLVIGGVEIAFEKGLAGWSDGDALTHAVIDALLGAAAFGDIGRHFPPGDPRYQGISSLALLKEAGRKLKEGGWVVVNIDATVMAAAPRLSPFITGMEQRLAQALDIEAGKISVKASTANGLGPAGRGEGIAAQAVALIEGSVR